MLRTLFAKLALGLTVLLVAIGLLYVFISTTATRQYFQQLNQELNRNLAQNLVADRNLVEQGRLNEDALKETFRIYMDINPSIEIYLLDLAGNILSYSADPRKIKRKRVSLKPIRTFLAMDQPYPLLGDDPRSHDRQKAFSVTPVPSAKSPRGYLYVVLRSEQFDHVERAVRDSYLARSSGWAVAASLAFGLLAGLIVFHLLTRRLRRLSTLIEAFDRGNFSDPMRYTPRWADGADEIDQLGLAFERMAGHIREQIERLKDQDAARRTFVAQISHDLRTPLAAMQGYLESLQIKGDKLSKKERAEFLKTALRQGRRLGGLVEELFELASLEAKQAKPDLIAFALAELIHDGVQKHRIKAERKDITVNFTANPDLPFAVGDIGLTERVLDNLLDNALTHTPRGGVIGIELAVAGESLEIAVSNSGLGIDPADLPHIFEPYYQRGKEAFGKHHAGLGLAIARRIMELQSGTISAQSVPGEGAVLTFRLPLQNT